MGTGSGRLTRPLLDLRARVVGVDLSHTKLRQLATRASDVDLPLVLADAADLPFPAGSFGGVISVHVLHLVPNWKRALHEFRRVLNQGGVYLRRGGGLAKDSPCRRMRRQWQHLLESSGFPQQHGAYDDRPVRAALEEMPAVCSPVEVAHQTLVTTPQQEVARIAARTRSGVWSVPGPALPRLLAGLRAWAATEFGSIEREFSCQEEFVLEVWRF